MRALATRVNAMFEWLARHPRLRDRSMLIRLDDAEGLTLDDIADSAVTPIGRAREDMISEIP